MTEATTIAIVAGAVAGIVAIVAAIAPTMVAYAALRQSRTNSVDAKEAAQKNDLDNAVIKGKVQEVHVLANDNLSKVTTDLRVATEKILGLEKLVSTLVENKKMPDAASLEKQSGSV